MPVRSDRNALTFVRWASFMGVDASPAARHHVREGDNDVVCH